MNKEVIEDFLTYCFLDRRMKESSLSRYRDNLRKFDDFVKKPIKEITGSDINRFIAYIKVAGNSTNTQRMYQTAIRMFFAWWAEVSQQENPCQYIVRIQEEIKTPRVPTSTDILRMIETCDVTEYIGRRNAAIIALLAGTGIRVSECAALKVGNVQVREKNFLLTVPRIKSHERVVPFGAFNDADLVGEFFSSYYLECKIVNKWGDNQPLWISAGIWDKNGKQLSKNGIQQMIIHLRKRAKVPDWITAHSFRHYFGTHFMANNGNIMELKALLGHALVETTMRYVHLANIISSKVISYYGTSEMQAPKFMHGYTRMMREMLQHQKSSKLNFRSSEK